MKYQPGLLDAFISPLTGKIRRLLFDLQKDYIITGNQNNEAFPSPILIDIRLKLIEVLTNLGQAKFIIQTEKEGFEDSQALDQLTNGFLYNTNGILSTLVPGSGTISLPYGQVLVGDEDDLAQATQLLNKQLLIGNASDRAEAITILFLENMANLSNKRIWRGNTSGRPEESDAVTNLENSVSSVLSDLANLASTINSLIQIVNALQSAVNAIEGTLALIGGVAGLIILQGQVIALEIGLGALTNRVTIAETNITVLQSQMNNLLTIRLPTIESNITTLENEITTIQNDISTIFGEIDDITFSLTTITNDITAINTRIDNLRLNTIPADGDVSFYGYKLTNLADATEETDGVNVRILKETIAINMDNITLDGFVEGDSDSTGFIHTTRGPDCLLTNIPAGGNVSMDNYKINNLVSDDVEQLDALNAKFLWDLMHDNVGVVYV